MIINEIKESKEVYYDVSSSIAAKESEIQLYRTKHAQDMADYHQHLKAYEDLQNQMDSESDAVKKEILMIQFSKAKAPTPPDAIDDKIKRLETQIRKTRTEDSKKYQTALRDAKTQPLSFSGSYQKLIIDDLEI